MSTRTSRGIRAYRFDDFELDVRSAELRRNGERVRLQEQPYRLLLMLLEHSGEVVLREEIRKHLWPNDTVVEISHGINAAVLRLRDALGESVEYPRRIETVARRGYRFLGHVETVSKDLSASVRIGLDTAHLSGQTLSHFRVLDRLGAGGMGVVYRAEDLKLGRQVAIKFLPPELSSDPIALARFEREARTASALNHPNVCTVYSVEDCGGQPAIVMELLEGATLEARLAAKGFDLQEALTLAAAILSALEAAHRKGIVHRDLKPSNVVLCDGGVKILDFGLAKEARSGRLTHDGAIVGTPNYMAPELLEGAKADASSDIYAFGILLREMLPAPIPDALHSVMARCTAPEREQRWQSAGELKAALERVHGAARPADGPPAAAGSQPSRGTMARRAWIAAGVGAAGVTAILLQRVLPAIPLWGSHSSVSRIALPGAAPIQRLTLSPDGRRLAFVTGGRIFVRDLEKDQERYIEGTEGAGTPFWSPEGQWLAFTAAGKLKKTPFDGGAVATLCNVNTNLSGTWNSSGDILIGQIGDGIFHVRDSGGPLTRITTPNAAAGEARHMMPQFLPDGRRFLYIAASGKPDSHILYAGFLGSEKREAVMPVPSLAMYVHGHLVFSQDRQIVAQAFDPVSLRPSGSIYRIGGPVLTLSAAQASIGIGIFSAAGRTLVYSPAPGGVPDGGAAQAVRNPAELVLIRNWVR